MHTDQQPNDMQRNALSRFYGLVGALVGAVFMALASIALMPGLQDPATGRLPESATLALVILPIALYIGFTLVFVLTNRRPR